MTHQSTTHYKFINTCVFVITLYNTCENLSIFETNLLYHHPNVRTSYLDANLLLFFEHPSRSIRVWHRFVEKIDRHIFQIHIWFSRAFRLLVGLFPLVLVVEKYWYHHLFFNHIENIYNFNIVIKFIFVLAKKIIWHRHIEHSQQSPSLCFVISFIILQ